jgi:hypothetical protein
VKEYTKTIRVQAVQWTGENLEEVKALLDLLTNEIEIDHNSIHLCLSDGDESWCVVKVGDWVLSQGKGDWNVLTNISFTRDYKEVSE